MATAQLINSGGSSPYTPGSDLAAGSVVVQNDLIGVNNQPILSGVEGTLIHKGKFLLPKDNSTAFAAGVIVYWDVSAQEITETATANIYFGKVETAALAADTTIRVRMDQ